jgi:hypothetical protein
MKNTLKRFCAASILAASIVSGSAFATAHWDGPAGPLILQNSTAMQTSIYYTNSPCASGLLTLDPADSVDRNKLLWATVLAVKANGGKITFDYDVGAGPVCYIRNFSVDPT